MGSTFGDVHHIHHEANADVGRSLAISARPHTSATSSMPRPTLLSRGRSATLEVLEESVSCERIPCRSLALPIGENKKGLFQKKKKKKGFSKKKKKKKKKKK